MTFLLLVLVVFAPLQSADQFSATVTKEHAVFSLPVEARDKWIWRRPETRPNQQEYRMDVTVKNEGKEYTFGFYVWKKAGSSSASGTLKDLISSGQKSLFVRADSGLMSIVHEAEVRVKVKDNRVEISIDDKDDLKRLFSGHPTEVTFKTKYPDAPGITEIVPIVYQ